MSFGVEHRMMLLNIFNYAPLVVEISSFLHEDVTVADVLLYCGYVSPCQKYSYFKKYGLYRVLCDVFTNYEIIMLTKLGLSKVVDNVLYFNVKFSTIFAEPKTMKARYLHVEEFMHHMLKKMMDAGLKYTFKFFDINFINMSMPTLHIIDRIYDTDISLNNFKSISSGGKIFPHIKSIVYMIDAEWWEIATRSNATVWTNRKSVYTHCALTRYSTTCKKIRCDNIAFDKNSFEIIELLYLLHMFVSYKNLKIVEGFLKSIERKYKNGKCYNF